MINTQLTNSKAVSHLKYTVIKSLEQYRGYCGMLEDILENHINDPDFQDDIDLLTLLIETWDRDHSTSHDTDTVTLLKGLMANHDLKSKDLAAILRACLNFVFKSICGHFYLRQSAVRRT